MTANPVSAPNTSDPGDETARRFRYQHAYGVILWVAAFRKELAYDALWCEQHEDFLGQLSEREFDAYQIKTREAEHGYWEFSDESLYISIARFAKLDLQFPEQIRRFYFVSNARCANTAKADRQHLCPGLVLKGCTGPEPLPEFCRRALTFLAEKTGYAEEPILAVLKRTIIQAAPSLPDMDDAVRQSHLSAVNGLAACSAAQLTYLFDRLLSRIRDASSLASDNPARHYPVVDGGLAQAPQLLNKRVAVADLSQHVENLKLLNAPTTRATEHGTVTHTEAGGSSRVARPLAPVSGMDIPEWIPPITKPPETEIQFLMAQYRALDLIGRQEEMESLRVWLASQPGLSVRVLIGNAGSGKTRLALELFHDTRLRLPEWRLGVLDTSSLRNLTAKNVDELTWSAPTLVLVDYAQSLADGLREFLSKLNRVNLTGRPPFRLLLLERSAGEWFERLVTHDEFSSYATSKVGALFDPPTPVPIVPLPTGQMRRALLGDALTKVARAAKYPAVQLPPPAVDPEIDRILGEDQFCTPLRIALAAVAAHHLGLSRALRQPTIDNARFAASRERQRIERFAPAGAPSEHTKLIAWLAACATLQGGLTSEELQRAVRDELNALRLQWNGGSGVLENLLREALSHDFLAVTPIEPDFVGEAFFLLVLAQPQRGVEREGMRPWRDVVLRCANRDLLQVVERLIRAWQNFGTDNGTAQTLLAAIDTLVDNAYRRRDLVALTAMFYALPGHVPDLKKRSLSIAETLSTLMIGPADDITDSKLGSTSTTSLFHSANFCRRVAARLSEAEKWNEAVGPAERYVMLCDWLAGKDAKRFQPYLIDSIDGFVQVARRSQKRWSALERVIAACRKSVDKAPTAFRPQLVELLPMLIVDLAEKTDGRRADRYRVKRYELLGLAEEFEKNYYTIGGRRAEPFNISSGGTLLILALLRSENGNRDTAIAAAQEAERIYRDLTRNDSVQYIMEWVKTLKFLQQLITDRRPISGEFIEPDQTSHPQAAHALQDALKLFSGLALVNSAKHKIGNDEAVNSAREAVAVTVELMGKDGAEFSQDFARAQEALGATLSAIGRGSEAASAYERGITALKQFTWPSPNDLHELNRCLHRGYLDACVRGQLEIDPELRRQAALLGAKPGPPT